MKKKVLLQLGILFLISVIILFILSRVKIVSIPLILAVYLTIFTSPILKKIRGGKLQDQFYALLAILISSGITAIILIVSFNEISREIVFLSDTLPKFKDRLSTEIIPFLQYYKIPVPSTTEELMNLFFEKVQSFASGLLRPTTSIINNIFSGLINFALILILTPFFSFYMLNASKNIHGFINKIIPLEENLWLKKIIHEVREILKKIVIRQGITAMLMALLYITGFMFVGLNLAVTIGTISGALYFLPYIDVLFVVITATLSALMQFGISEKLYYVLGWIVIVKLLDSFLLTPHIVGKNVGLSPVTVVIAILVGGQLFGLWGILLALPLAAVAKVCLSTGFEFYRESDFYKT